MMVWYGMVWYGMDGAVWYGQVRYGSTPMVAHSAETL